MKFWQLESVLRGSNLLNELVEQQPRWKKYRQYLEDYDHLVDVQNRDVLDEIVDPELCRVALAAWDHQFWINEHDYLVEYQPQRDMDVDRERLISACDAYERYGGEVLKDVLEYGSVRVPLGPQRDPENKYLWTIDQRGVNILLERTPANTPRGHIVHTNLSSKAFIGGEAWFESETTVVINAGSGRFGYGGGATEKTYQAAIRFWQKLAYTVMAIPFGQR